MKKTIQSTTKYLGIAALLSATAVVSTFAAGATGSTSTTSSTTRSARFGGGPRHTLTDAEKAERKANTVSSLATVLGTTADVITAQLNAGKTLQDIVKASGQDEKVVREKLGAAHLVEMKARLAADVTS